jgi:glycine/D-amino acid oxidase-like deaminating enzyme
MKLKSSEPFWLVKNGCINSYSSLRHDLKTDILIVGGGITGSLIAHQCVADGYQTTLVDRREIGHGSTSATTSMLQYGIDTPLHELIDMIGETGAVASYKACFQSIDDLARITRQVKSNCGFTKKKSLYFAALKKDVPSLKLEFEARKQHGFPVRWLEADQIEKQYQLQETHGGILSDQGGSIDAFLLTHELLAYNVKRGLQVYDKTNIKKTDYHRQGVTALDEYGNTITASKVIYCNGFESVELIKDQFVKLLSTYAIVGERSEMRLPHLSRTLFWNTAEPYLYLRTTDDHRILIGGQDEEFVDASQRDALLTEKASRLEKALHRLLPDSDFRTDFVWAGTFGETKDGLPYIGEHPNFPNSYFVLGFGGNGITFSVVGMQLISEMLQGKEPTLAEYFRFRR